MISYDILIFNPPKKNGFRYRDIIEIPDFDIKDMTSKNAEKRHWNDRLIESRKARLKTVGATTVGANSLRSETIMWDIPWILSHGYIPYYPILSHIMKWFHTKCFMKNEKCKRTFASRKTFFIVFQHQWTPCCVPSVQTSIQRWDRCRKTDGIGNSGCSGGSFSVCTPLQVYVPNTARCSCWWPKYCQPWPSLKDAPHFARPLEATRSHQPPSRNIAELWIPGLVNVYKNRWKSTMFNG